MLHYVVVSNGETTRAIGVVSVGRKKAVKDSNPTSFRLSDATMKKLDKNAMRLGMTRARLIEVLIDRYSDYLEHQFTDRRESGGSTE
jgi:hypothetical protein